MELEWEHVTFIFKLQIVLYPNFVELEWEHVTFIFQLHIVLYPNFMELEWVDFRPNGW